VVRPTQERTFASINSQKLYTYFLSSNDSEFEKIMPPMNAWLNLRQLLDVVNADTDFKSIDERSQRLLEWIVAHYSPDRPMFVQTIVMKSDVASPATIHKGLAILEREGMITVKVDSEDTRRRIVSPTERAKKLMAKLSQRVKAWADGLQA
jgi:DNA-binding MarR family transcriptional regulator